MDKFRDLLNNVRLQPGEVVAGRYIRELPSKKIKMFSQDPVSAFCGPPGCMKDVHQQIKKRLETEGNITLPKEIVTKNLKDWNQRKDFADGHVTSLYEKSTAGDEKKLIGDPVADSLAIVTRRDSCILALADGVSWGPKSKLASTCSIYGSVTFLNEHLHTCKNTKDVFRCILKAFEKAQNCIVSEQATMTTLCVGVVVRLHEKDRWALCVVNVGDSYAYVYNREKGVKEVTEFSHPIDEKRDMRQSGGALGPADGYNPDLGNLTCSFMTLEQGDLVFLCSDGVSDNFDPVIAKFTPKLQRRGDNTNNEVPHLEHNQSFEEIMHPGDKTTTENDNEQKSCDHNNMMSHNDVIVSRDDKNNARNTTKQQTLTIITDDYSDLDDYHCVEETHNMCEKCLNAQSSDNPLNVPALLSSQPRKSKIWEFFPNISDNQSARPPSPPEDVNKIFASSERNIIDKNEDAPPTLLQHCKKCGDVIKRGDEDRRNSLLPFTTTESTNQLRKLSTSVSVDNMMDAAKSQEGDHATWLKSSSFSSVGSNQTNSKSCKLYGGVQHDKDVAVSMLKQGSSVVKLNSYPSIDFTTGKKNKEENLSDVLTSRERRLGALERMTEIIDEVEPTEDGFYDVGEVCAQVINFVMRNTEQKRQILEKVPQSALILLSSKERKEHHEKIKKELEGIPGKLDHASIVCYEVGVHGNVNTFKLDRQKSAPAATINQVELPPNAVQDFVEHEPKQADGFVVDNASINGETTFHRNGDDYRIMAMTRL